MKRRDLLRAAQDIARSGGKEWILLRTTGAHDVFRVGSRSVSVPRHREINELTARSILRSVRDESEGSA